MALNPTQSPSNVQVRYRNRSGLKPLDIGKPPSFLFDATETRSDHIKLTGSLQIIVPTVQHTAYIEAIDHRDGSGLDIFRVTGHGNGPWRVTMPQGMWLFSFKGKAYWQEAGSRFDVRFELHLNPTRFLAHHPTIPLQAIDGYSPSTALRLDPAVRNALHARTLDATDNILDNVAAYASSAFSARRSWWRNCLDVYISKVEALIVEGFTPIGQHAEVVGLSFSNIAKVETYWELSHTNAITFAAQLGRALAASDTATRLFQKLVIGTDVNASWCKLVDRRAKRTPLAG